MSVLADLAQAIVDEINGGALGVTATRHYNPVVKLKDAGTLQVLVVPRSQAIANEARGTVTHDPIIDVGFIQRLDEVDLATVDALMDKVQEIIDFLTRKVLGGAPNMRFVRVENDPVYAPEHLDQRNQFTSVASFTYRARRTAGGS